MAGQQIDMTGYSASADDFARKRKMAEILRGQSMTGQQGQMVSGHYVAPNIMQHIAQLYQGYRSGQLDDEANKGQQDLARQLREQGAKDMEGVMGAMQGAPEQRAEYKPDTFDAEDAQAMPQGMQSVTPEVKPDRRKAMALALQSINPNVQGVGAKLLETELAKPKGININGQMVNENTGDFMGQRISKQPEAFTLGDTRFGADGKPVATYRDPNKAFMPDGTANIEYQAYEKDLRSRGAPSVSVKNDVNMGKGLAGEVGPMMKDSTAQSEGAVKQVTAVNNLLKAIDSGNVIGGSGATLRLKGAQLSQMLGIGGKDEAEKIENTRAAIREFSQLTLQGRKQMTGQGAITESEGKLAEKANSGEIDDLTVPEMRQLALAANRAARFNHNEHLRKMKVMESNPDLAGMAPFYQGPAMPAEYVPPKAGNAPVLRFDASGNMVKQ